MEDSNNIFRKEKQFLLQTYQRFPIKISHGKGVYLFTEDGNKYLDFFSGLGVIALGHGNEKIIHAIEEQIKKYIHLSNYYLNPPQVELAEKLVKYSGMSKVFFTNSGTEAIEASLKLIRKYFGPDRRIVYFSNAFHGRTYGSLSIGGKEKYKKYFTPLLPNTVQLEFNNIEQLENKIDRQVAAVYLEFIQGEGGVRIASEEFVAKLRMLKDKFNFILIADEVQSGIGRTGKPFAYNHFDVFPDIAIVAKAIGGGLPLGAMIVNQEYSNVFESGDHGSTFGGNPVACSAGLTVLNEVLDNGLVKEVNRLGDYFLAQLNVIKDEYPNQIADVRGFGFMIGVELFQSCSRIIEAFRENGILVNCTNDNVLRILPPLISTQENIDFFIKEFRSILSYRQQK